MCCALVQTPNNLLIPHSLVTRKDNGGLFFLSMDVWKIIRLCGIAFRVYVSGRDFRKPNSIIEQEYSANHDKQSYVGIVR